MQKIFILGLLLIFTAAVPLWGFDYIVQGINQDMSSATLRHCGTSEKLTVHIGEQVGGFTVTKIESDVVTLNRTVDEGNNNRVAGIIIELPVKSNVNKIKVKSQGANPAP